MSTHALDSGTVSALAHAFARGLRRDLTPALLADIDAANAACADDTCATHDYVDSNEVMDGAFAAVMGRAFNGERDDDCALWEAAWSEAKAAGYATLAQEVTGS